MIGDKENAAGLRDVLHTEDLQIEAERCPNSANHLADGPNERFTIKIARRFRGLNRRGGLRGLRTAHPFCSPDVMAACVECASLMISSITCSCERCVVSMTAAPGAIASGPTALD